MMTSVGILAMDAPTTAPTHRGVSFALVNMATNSKKTGRHVTSQVWACMYTHMYWARVLIRNTTWTSMLHLSISEFLANFQIFPLLFHFSYIHRSMCCGQWRLWSDLCSWWDLLVYRWLHSGLWREKMQWFVKCVTTSCVSYCHSNIDQLPPSV